MTIPTGVTDACEEEPAYFEFSATLRIYGDSIDVESISRTLGLTPTHTHRKGDRSALGNYGHDMWSFSVAINPSHPLAEHIQALWDAIRPGMPYLRSLKARHTVDVFCGYRSNQDTAGFDIDYRCLGLFQELQVPMIVSVIT